MPKPVCRCAVPQCTVPKRRNHPGGVSSFTFPVKDPERCKKWVKAVKNPKYDDNTPLKVLQHERVCSLHFKPEEFENLMMRYRLMGGRKPPAVLSTTAVPSISLDEAESVESAEPPLAKRSRTQVNVVPSATKDASPHVPRTFTAHETYEANILSLFKRCQICGCPINSTDVHYVRGKMRVKWDCFGGHAGTWNEEAMLKVDNPEDSLDEEENVMVSEDGSDSNWDPPENSTDGMFTDKDSCTDEIDAEDDAGKESYTHVCKFCLKPFKTRPHKLAHEQSHLREKVPDPGMKVQMEKTTRNQSEPEAEKNEMESNAVVRETNGTTLRPGRKKRRLHATINRKKKRLTGRPKGRPQINTVIASGVTDKLKRKLCDGDENDESWSNCDSPPDSADEEEETTTSEFLDLPLDLQVKSISVTDFDPTGKVTAGGAQTCEDRGSRKQNDNLAIL